MIDRSVQFPNRYKLTLVDGTTDTYDFIAVPGAVTAEGDDLNVANLFPDSVAIALGLDPATNPQVKDGFTALNKPPLYEKIRDIPNVSVAGGVSLDLSDIQLSDWLEIRLIAELQSSTAVAAIIRVNNMSNLGDYRVKIPYASATDAVNYYSLSVPASPDFTLATIPFKITPSATGYYHIGTGEYATYASPGGAVDGAAGAVKSVVAKINSINITPGDAGYTLYITNSTLWGMRR